jgi:hypothetical protein
MGDRQFRPVELHRIGLCTEFRARCLPGTINGGVSSSFYWRAIRLSRSEFKADRGGPSIAERYGAVRAFIFEAAGLLEELFSPLRQASGFFSFFRGGLRSWSHSQPISARFLARALFYMWFRRRPGRQVGAGRGRFILRKTDRAEHTAEEDDQEP